MKKFLINILVQFKLLAIFLRNIIFVYLRKKDQAHAFEGYGRKWLSRKYADQRTYRSKVNKYCGGKMHYVLPLYGNMLVVLNSLEIQKLQNKNILKKKLNIKDILAMAYYVSDNKVKAA